MRNYKDKQNYRFNKILDNNERMQGIRTIASKPGGLKWLKSNCICLNCGKKVDWKYGMGTGRMCHHYVRYCKSCALSISNVNARNSRHRTSRSWRISYSSDRDSRLSRYLYNCRKFNIPTSNYRLRSSLFNKLSNNIYLGNRMKRAGLVTKIDGIEVSSLNSPSFSKKAMPFIRVKLTMSTGKTVYIDTYNHDGRLLHYINNDQG